jgi:hypothetical protein
MTRLFALLAALLTAPLLSGCLVVKTVEVAAGVTGAAIGAAGAVAGGAIDIVTPDGDDKDEEDDSEER